MKLQCGVLYLVDLSEVSFHGSPGWNSIEYHQCVSQIKIKSLKWVLLNFFQSIK